LEGEADLIVLGGGASGLMVSQATASIGAKVVCLERNSRPGRKILVSGGGRCNYTNLGSKPENFVTSTKRFCHSALRGFKAEEAAGWFRSIGIEAVEKKKGQLFCRDGANFFLKKLLQSVDEASGELINGVGNISVEDTSEGFKVTTDENVWKSKHLVVATGGLSWSKLGVSDLGYQIARQYGHQVTHLKPGLVPVKLKNDDIWRPDLKGISLSAIARVGKVFYEDDLLMTHFGLSGPVILQISGWMDMNQELCLDLLPGTDVIKWIRQKKEEGYRGELRGLLGEKMPARLATSIASALPQQKVAQLKKTEIKTLGGMINRWRPTVIGNMGYDKAEVTLGGVSCAEISSKTMESQRRSGLYFVGEVLDVTGELGGFNFQWAWASAMACARGVGERLF